MPDSSMEVLNRLRQGDPEALEAVFRDHHAAVYRWVLRIVRNAAEAEDLTVESFWRIYTSWPHRGRSESRIGRGVICLCAHRAIGARWLPGAGAAR